MEGWREAVKGVIGGGKSAMENIVGDLPELLRSLSPHISLRLQTHSLLSDKPETF